MLAMNTLVDRLSVPVTASVPKSAIADDMAMIRATSELTRELVQPSARNYWNDFLASTFVGYWGIEAAILAPGEAWTLDAAVISVVACFCAASFLQEVTPTTKPSFTGWVMLDDYM